MSNVGDPCTTRVFWSAITAAPLDSTVAGVLAGLLIAAAAALLVQSYQGSDAHTIALFGSGVPALALSTYTFTVIAGLDYLPKAANDQEMRYTTPGSTGDILCSQLWSEWVLAIGSLFIGVAVLVCGLAWALVSYADNLAVKLCENKVPIKAIEHRRSLFIQLNGWLSGAAITAVTALLISANVTYLTAIGQLKLHWRILDETWYLLFFVYFVGIYSIGRSSYAVFRRTRSALRANQISCAAYPSVGSKYQRPESDPGFARRVAREFSGVAWVALAAALAGCMTSGQAFNAPRGITVSRAMIIQFIVLYIVARAAHIRIARFVKWMAAKEDITAIDDESDAVGSQKPEERIRIRYAVGQLSATTCSAVVLAILGTFFVVWLTQGPLVDGVRIVISLILGGAGPAVVLHALSYSVPAAEKPRCRSVPGPHPGDRIALQQVAVV